MSYSPRLPVMSFGLLFFIFSSPPDTSVFKPSIYCHNQQIMISFNQKVYVLIQQTTQSKGGIFHEKVTINDTLITLYWIWGQPNFLVGQPLFKVGCPLGNSEFWANVEACDGIEYMYISFHFCVSLHVE